MDRESIGIVAIVLGLILTVLSLIFIVPKKRREEFGGFSVFLHDLFNFKALWIEYILKATYIFSTFYIIIFGFFSIFQEYGDFGDNFISGVATMILGPVLIRVAYELIMMFVLLVNNVIDINNKLGGKTPAPATQKKEVKAEKKVEQQEKKEAQGTERNAFCVSCGKPFADDNAFCMNCGAKR